MKHIVRLPLGLVKVELDREGLSFTDRGGFKAEWSVEDTDVLSEDAYFQVIKNHLADVYLLQEKREPSRISINLVAHQLLDDLKGWTKLNSSSRNAR